MGCRWILQLGMPGLDYSACSAAYQIRLCDGSGRLFKDDITGASLMVMHACRLPRQETL